MFHVPERFRDKAQGSVLDGNNGAFRFKTSRGQELFVIASDGLGWEHVSVSTPIRCPTWEEMCEVKGTFWSPEDTVVQLHPPHSEYVNCHPFCLHLWRPFRAGPGWIPTPPRALVGP